MLGKDIKNLVIVKMEEYTPYGPLEGGVTVLSGGDRLNEVKPVYAYIDKNLAQAANEMLTIAPLHLLMYKTADVTAEVDTLDNRIGTIDLPSDFLRLHTLRMHGWTKPLHWAINEGTPAYSLQFSEWTRGTKQKPVATLEGLGEMTEEQSEVVNTIQRKMHYYSVDSSDSHQIDEFKYISVFNEGAEYNEGVAELIALHCARKIAEIYGTAEQVTMMTNELNSVLENIRL